MNGVFTSKTPSMAAPVSTLAAVERPDREQTLNEFECNAQDMNR
jgi:hypothetical protein